MLVPKPRMNIATSCDDGYSHLVMVNLSNIHDVLSQKYDVHFYLLQSAITTEKKEQITSYASTLNLHFEIVTVTEQGFLETVSQFSNARDTERFYDGACHLFLPTDVDRVLYIDTGDVLFLDDDYGFYFEDFQGRSLLISTYWKLQKDKWNFEKLQGMWGGFNSGHMLINLERLRAIGLGPKDYTDYVEAWSNHFPEKKILYGGDQAFLTGFFAGDISVIPKGNPYNVKVIDLNGQHPQIPPKSIHLNAMFGNIKPWEVPFTSPKDLASLTLIVPKIDKNGMQSTQRYFSGYENECILLWWEYCKKTPVYADLKNQSMVNQKLLRLAAKHIRNSAVHE